MSVVVVAFDMERELPRTLLSLGPTYQRELSASDYELIVVDNASPTPVSLTTTDGLKLIRVEDGGASPARAVNAGLAAARGDVIGVLVDGARLASPGLLAQALRAQSVCDRAVVVTPSFHLGPGLQRDTMLRGYDVAAENELLTRIGWPEDGYRLFEIAALAGSSARGVTALPAEANALFMARGLWNELGGYDERFVSAGGGLVNLDTLARACDLPRVHVVSLLGEGTFHQIHGGVTTNNPGSRWDEFHAEYTAIRGHRYSEPDVDPLLLATPDPFAVSGAIGYDGRVRPTLPPVHGRTFETDLPPHLLQTIQLGIYKMRYRGVPLYKNPFDLALFTRLWSKLKPRTVIEVGAKDGGSALWFADLMRAHRVEGTIISIDLVLPERVSDPMIDFRQGDARTLQDVLSAQELAELPHPLLVVEDSAHFYETSRAVLDFFHPHLRRGDYVVVEDGSVSFFGTPEFQVYDDGPNRAVTDFLEAHVDEYEIDVTLCDLFGRNVTANPNGWIKRTRPVRSR